MTKHATVKMLPFDAAVNDYGATWICNALARYIIGYCNPTLTPAEVEQESLTVSYQFPGLPVFHKIKFVLDDA